MASLYREYICYATGCAKKNPIDLKIASSSIGHVETCSSCGKQWAVSFKGKTCCSLVLLFVSIEAEGKKALTKLQRFKTK